MLVSPSFTRTSTVGRGVGEVLGLAAGAALSSGAGLSVTSGSGEAVTSASVGSGRRRSISASTPVFARWVSTMPLSMALAISGLAFSHSALPRTPASS